MHDISIEWVKAPHEYPELQAAAKQRENAKG